MIDPVIWDWPREYRATIDSQFYLLSTSLSAVSPYTGEVSVYGPQMQKFVAKLTFPRLLPADWRTISAIITRTRGISGLLRMVDYHRMYPARDLCAAEKVTGTWSDSTTWSDGGGWIEDLLPPFIEIDAPAPEGATSFVVRGLPASVDRCLRMGDLCEVRPNGIPASHGHLYEIVRHARTNGAGKTRLTFEPGLRKDVAAGDMLVLRHPTSVFRLASDQEGVISRGIVSVGNIGLSLTEVTPWQ